jgi:hypothetical protein
MSSNNLVWSAVELKQAIENVPYNVMAIGECFTMKNDWYHEHDKPMSGEEEDEDEDGGSEENGDEIQKHGPTHCKRQINEGLNKLVRAYERVFNHFVSGRDTNWNHYSWKQESAKDTDGDDKKRFTINIDNFAHNFNLNRKDLIFTQDDFNSAFENASESGFGDVHLQETRIDPSVRVSREITSEHFTVDDHVIECVQNRWSNHFYPDKVRAVPYKINLYRDGGKFAPHKDTPENDLVGTFLISLCSFPNSEGQKSGGLRVKVRDEWKHWDASSKGGWCAFYCDTEHEVQEICGSRANMAFKIKRERGEAAPLEPLPLELLTPMGTSTVGQSAVEMIQKVGVPKEHLSVAPFFEEVQTIQGLLPSEDFGIILSHHYSFATEPR